MTGGGVDAVDVSYPVDAQGTLQYVGESTSKLESTELNQVQIEILL